MFLLNGLTRCGLVYLVQKFYCDSIAPVQEFQNALSLLSPTFFIRSKNVCHSSENAILYTCQISLNEVTTIHVFHVTTLIEVYVWVMKYFAVLGVTAPSADYSVYNFNSFK